MRIMSIQWLQSSTVSLCILLLAHITLVSSWCEVQTRATPRKVLTVGFSNNANLFAYSDDDRQVYLYEYTNFTDSLTLISTFQARNDIYALDFNGNNSILVVAGKDRKFEILSVPSLNKINEIDSTPVEQKYDIDFSDDSTLMMICGTSTKIRIYNTTTWQIIYIGQSFFPLSAGNALTRCQFAYDNSIIAGDDKGKVYFSQPYFTSFTINQPLVFRFQSNIGDYVVGLNFEPNSYNFVASTTNGNGYTCDKNGCNIEERGSRLSSACYSPQNLYHHTFYSINNDTLWMYKPSQPSVNNLTVTSSESDYSSCDFSSQGRYYLAGNQDQIELWDLQCRCLNNQYFNQGMGICQECNTIVPECAVCSNSSYCYQCNQGFFPFSSSICKQCDFIDPQCGKCLSYSTQCTQCAPYFFPDPFGSGCLHCTYIDHCLECDNTTYNCTICQPGYYTNWTLLGCVRCYDSVLMPYCFNCDNYDRCIACQVGYYLQYMPPFTNYYDMDCIPCNYTTSNCVTCDSSQGNCTSCQFKYFLKDYPGDYDDLCLKCQDYNPDCQHCQNQTFCYTCKEGFFPNIFGDPEKALCELCNGTAAIASDCDICDSTTGNCTACIYGFYVIQALPYNYCQNCSLLIANCIHCNKTTPECITCKRGYFPYFGTCAPCTDIPNCLQCDSSDGNCTMCKKNYYYENFVCTPCDTSLANCDLCDNGTICITCDFGYFPDASSQCVSCTTISNCLSCDSTSGTCFACDIGYYLDSDTLDCLACDDLVTSCEFCYDNDDNTTVGITCLKCAIGLCVDYQANTCSASACGGTTDTTNSSALNPPTTAVCGDGYISNSQSCDDGNSQAGDGCSDLCIIERDFQCETDYTVLPQSTCFFVGQFSLQKIYTEKLENKNQVNITFNVSHNNLAFYEKMDLYKVLKVEDSSGMKKIKNYTIQRLPNNQVMLNIQYTDDLQNEDIIITMDPAASELPVLSKSEPTSITEKISPDNNLGAYFYDEDTYKMAEDLKTCFMIISVFGLLSFFLGFFSSKMVGVELMAVLQITFIGLISLSEMNPCFSAILNIKLVNGYNSLSQQSHLEDQYLSEQPKGIFLFSRFLENYNLTFILIGLPLLVGLISYIYYYFKYKRSNRQQVKELKKRQQEIKRRKKAKKVWQRSFGQYTFTGVMFGNYLISTSTIIEFIYGAQNTETAIGILSIIASAVLLLMNVGYFVFLCARPKYFGEYTDEFNPEGGFLVTHYYHMMMIERLIVSYALVLALQFSFQAIIPIVIFLLNIIFIIVKRPYKQKFHNIRVIANMVVSIFSMVVYIFYRNADSETRNSEIGFIMPIILCVLLIITIIHNMVALLYTIYKQCRKNKQKEYEGISSQETNRVTQILHSMRSPITAKSIRGQLMMNFSNRPVRLGSVDRQELQAQDMNSIPIVYDAI